MVPVATAIDTAREGRCPTPDSTVGAPRNYTTTADATDRPVAQDARAVWDASHAAARGAPGTPLVQLRSLVPIRRGLAPIREACLRRAREVVQERHRDEPSLAERLRDHLIRKAKREVRRRDGETDIDGVGLRLLDRDRGRGLVLVGCDGWRAYSRSFGSRRAALRYLYGTDDNGPWALRVPGTADNVKEALAAVVPAEVRRAEAQGRGVLRQGDVYAVEMRRRSVNDVALEDTHHRYDAEARRLVHEDEGVRHGDLVIPADWRGVKFIRQSGLGMGRLVRAKGRGIAD